MNSANILEIIYLFHAQSIYTDYSLFGGASEYPESCVSLLYAFVLAFVWFICWSVDTAMR